MKNGTKKGIGKMHQNKKVIYASIENNIQRNLNDISKTFDMVNHTLPIKSLFDQLL